MELALMAKAFKLNYSTPTNNNQRILSNTRNRQIAQPEMNMGQDRQMQIVGGNGGNQFRQYTGQNARNPAGVYFVEGLGHNLFSVGKFCDSDLEVAFRRNACFVRNLEGVDLLKGNRSTNLYTVNLQEMASASPICLMLVLRLLSLGYGINVYPTSTSTP
nr:integrase, catalytic region, zinc finger, CCHC-type, peptidase aspartic, catalytic [Tanacetum cinerariifolium]